MHRARTSRVPRRSRGSRGAVLVGVVILLPIILLGLAAYSQRGITEMDNARREHLRVQALYIAHAGLQKAAQLALDDPMYRGSKSNIAFGDGSYSYVVEGDETHLELGDRLRIVASGTILGGGKVDKFGTTVREIRAVVRRGLGRSVLDFAISSGGQVILAGGSDVGDPFNKNNKVYSGNTDGATLDESIKGTGGTWLYGWGEVITNVPQSSLPNMDPGPVEYEAEPLNFPVVDFPALRVKAENNFSNPQYPGGTYFVGDTTFENETIKGVIYVDGELDIVGNVDIEGVIVHTGPNDMDVEGNLTIDPDNNPMTGAPYMAIINQEARLVFKGTSKVDIEGYVITDEEIDFRADGIVKGALISEKNVELSGNCQVYFGNLDPTFIAEEVVVDAPWVFKFISWKESASY